MLTGCSITLGCLSRASDLFLDKLERLQQDKSPGSNDVTTNVLWPQPHVSDRAVTDVII
ncbi:hypothetical protein J6590_031747 [Homalodisca vitripennis]|nr:hypothetical protein J6590_031747 [Homalodisca vitripennis]